MSETEDEDIAIAIIRMERLLAGITSKIRDSIGEHNVQNSSPVQEIMNLLKFFKDSVIARMRSPKAERMHAIDLRDCHKKIIETLSELEVLQATFEEEKAKSEILFKDIVARINEKGKSIRSIRQTLEVEIPREIEESMSETLILRKLEEARKKQLQSEINMAKQKVLSVMEFNATAEKKLFEKCTKVEEKYADLLAEYDRDIGGTHFLMEVSLKEKDIIKIEKKNMKDQLIVQCELYIQLRKEREIALMKVFTERLELFRRSRAAKVIQRAWRTYLERVSLKKRRKMRRK